jgi:hypothetical protein
LMKAKEEEGRRKERKGKGEMGIFVVGLIS